MTGLCNYYLVVSCRAETRRAESKSVLDMFDTHTTTAGEQHTATMDYVVHMYLTPHRVAGSAPGASVGAPATTGDLLNLNSMGDVLEAFTGGGGEDTDNPVMEAAEPVRVAEEANGTNGGTSTMTGFDVESLLQIPAAKDSPSPDPEVKEAVVMQPLNTAADVLSAVRELAKSLPDLSFMSALKLTPRS